MEWASSERLEQVHTEQKVMRDRLIRVEERVQVHEQSLVEGRKTFDDIRAAIVLLRDEARPKRMETWKLLLAILPGAALITGWIWSAARLSADVAFLGHRMTRIEAKIDGLQSVPPPPTSARGP